MVFGAQTHTPKMCKQIDVFAFSQEAQIFLKARCARLEPWHLLPLRRNICRQRCTSKQLLTARCAARAFLFAVCAAAVLRAHQLCSWSTSRSKSKERGAWSIGKKSAACTALQCKLQPTLWNSTFPPVFSLRKWPFSPLPSQNFRLRRALLTPPLLGGAARPESATLTVTIIHAWSSMVVDVQGVQGGSPF